jgi:outer membrane usher protein
MLDFKLHQLQAVVLLACAAMAKHAFAEEYFHADLLRIGGEAQQTEESIAVLADNEFLPGVYEVRLNINRKLAMVREVDFVLHQGQVIPCLSKELLTELGLKLGNAEEFAWEDQSCVDSSKLDYVDFIVNWENRSLNLTVPQIHVDEKRLLKAQEKLWDNGVNHFSMNYAFSSYTTQDSSSNQYLNLRPRVNIGAWRLQNYSVWTNQLSWNHINTSASRSLVSLRSEVSLGDTYSSSSMFDSLKLRGISLQSSEQMRSASERSYVPTISGIANTDALLTVVQSGNIIYRANVPAGPYAITDYYPASMGGDLTVSLREADGVVKTSIVPYAALPIMEKKGRFKYSFSSGRLQEDTGPVSNQYVNQLEVVYGLTEQHTVYSGLQASQNYKAVVLGVGSNLGSWGALATDLTRASHKLWDGRTESGSALKLNYAKGFETSTMLSMTYSRSLNDGFARFRSAVMQPDSDREKSQLNLALSQTLPNGLGALSLNMSRYEQQNNKSSISYSLGYNGSYKSITYGVYVNKYSNEWSFGGNTGSSVSVTASIPLSLLTGQTRSNTSVSYSASRDQNQDVDQSVRLSGTAMDNQLSWGAYQGYGNHGMGAYGGVNTAYRSNMGDLNASYAYTGGGNRNWGFGATGALTVTPYGAVMSRSLHESNALVLVPDAKNVRVKNQASIETNRWGLAIVPGMGAFRSNTVTLSTDTIPDNVEIENNVVTNLFPTKGALILSRFETRLGHKTLFVVNNQEIPTGAKARIANTDTVSVASGFNQVYMVMPTQKGRLELSWLHDGLEKHCSMDFDIQHANKAGGLYLVNAACLPNQEELE